MGPKEDEPEHKDSVTQFETALEQALENSINDVTSPEPAEADTGNEEK